AQQEDRPHRRLSADGGAARDPGLARDRRQRFQGDGQGAPEAGRPDDADSRTAHRRALQQVRTPARRRRKTAMQQAQTFAAKNWRDLIRPKALEVDKETLTGTYGKFFAEPLERGFGITIGNTLRRVLLSSLQGGAICALKLDGALHEFTTIPDVAEDV